MEWLFGHGADLSWWQECARAVVVFAYGLAALRIAGRRMFGKWSVLDIILSVIIGSNLSRAITGSAQLWTTLGATTLLIALHYMLARAVAQWPWFSRLIEGVPTILGSGGTVDRGRLQHAKVSQADLDEALRQAGVEHVEHTRSIVVEPSGKISVLKA